MAFLISLYSIVVNFFILSNRHFWQYTFVIGRFTTIVEFSLFSFLFYRIIVSSYFKNGIAIIFFLVNTYLVYTLITFSKTLYDSVPVGITAMIFFIYCIFYLFERVRDASSLFLYSSPDFWVVVAIIIYSAGTFFPFIFAQSNLNKPDFDSEYILIHSTLYVLKNLLLCIAMLTKDKTQTASYSIPKKKWHNFIPKPTLIYQWFFCKSQIHPIR